MLLDTFVPHLVPCLLGVKQFLVGKYKRSWGNIHIQRDLNEIFEYPPFELEIRLAYVTNTVAFTCLYFPTLPLLLPLAVISLTISSWVDHVMLLRFYSKPPAYSKEIIFMSMKYLPLIIFISVTWNLFMPLRDVFVHVFKTADPSVASVDLDQLWSLKLLFYAFCAIFLQDAVLHAVGVFIPYRVKQLVVTNLVHLKQWLGMCCIKLAHDLRARQNKSGRAKSRTIIRLQRTASRNCRRRKKRRGRRTTGSLTGGTCAGTKIQQVCFGQCNGVPTACPMSREKLCIQAISNEHLNGLPKSTFTRTRLSTTHGTKTLSLL